MEDPVKEFDYVKARTLSIEEKIEIAFDLVATIDFQKLLESSILKNDFSPLKLKISYGSFQLVNESRELQLKSQEFAFKILHDRAATKLELQNQLGDIASWIIYNHKIFEYLKAGHVAKYSIIGMAWAKSETLIKYREILLNFEEPQLETTTREQPITDLDSHHSDTTTSKNEFYIEICEGLNFKSILDYIGKQTDLETLGLNLEGQLAAYAKRCGEGFEKHDANKDDLWGARYHSRDKWLKHTTFICKDEYNKTNREIFNEAVKWCENWREKYLYLFNPYSPQEEASRHKDLYTPLWKQLINETKPITKPKPKKTYGWNTKISEIQKDKLFSLLIKGGFIFENTRIVDFKCALSNNQLPDDYTPVVWIRKQSDLICLFESIVDSAKRPKQPWTHFNKLFNIDAPGQLFNTGSLKNQYQVTGPTVDLQEILNKL